MANAKQHSKAFRFDDETLRQIEFLAQRWGHAKANVSAIIVRSIERTYQEEMNQMNRTYRVTRRADTELFIPSDSHDPILDFSVDLDAVTETESVDEYLIGGRYADWFERLLDASPAVVRWEVVKGNWPAPVR